MPDQPLELTLAGLNLGNGTPARVIADLRMLLTELGVDVVGTCETGDRADEVNAIAKAQGVDLLRNPRGAPNRLAMLLNGITADDWGYFPLNPGHEDIEPTVPGGRDESAEPKFILWTEVAGITAGMTHFIPGTAQRRLLPNPKTGRRPWKHPGARAVYKVQVQRAVEWFEQGGDVLMGDVNGVPNYNLLAPLRKVADVYTAASRKKPRRIDHVYVRKGSGITVVGGEVIAIDDVSSDHPAIIARLQLPTVPSKAPEPHVRAAHLIERLAETVERPKVKAELLEAAAGRRAKA